MRRVGIPGGVGPEATILIMQKVLAAVTARDDADHIPLLVDQNPQVPSRRLVAGGAEALAIPCNTAHHYAATIRAAVSVPLLDMVETSAAHAAALAGPGGRIGVLASPAVRKVGLFDAPFARHGLTGYYAEDETAMLAAIRQLKASGPQPEARQTLTAASQALFERGAKVQMIACTEFSLIVASVSGQARAFDTLDILVSAIKDFALFRGAEGVLR